MRALIESLGLPGIDAAAWAPPLWRHTGGNPLFLLETLRAVLRDDAAPALRALPTPAPLAELIERRLQRLSAPALRLARLASIADSDFDIELAAAVLGVHPLDLADPWRELEGAQVVRDGGFAHDLVLDAMRAGIPEAVARALHAQIAEQLARRALPAARVAMHWQAAQRWPEAAAAHEAAARHALSASRRADELMHRRQVIAACNKGGDVDGAFRARVNTVEPLLFVESVEQAQGLADGLLDDALTPAQRLAAQLARAQTLLMAARAAEAMVAADEARALAAADDNRPRERIAARYLAVGLAQAQRADEAVALLEPYQAGLPDDPADDDTYRFWSDMAYALQAANQRARCAAALERAIAGGEARGDLAEVLTNLSNRSGVKGNLGQLDAALVDAQRAQRLSERLGDVAGVPAGALHIHLGLLSACSGRLGSALRHFDAAHELFVKAGQNTWVAVARNHRADVLLNLGQVARARQALPADDAALFRATRARRLIVAARIERALGHSPRPLLTQSIAILGPVGDSYMRLLAQVDALRAQDPAEAAEAALLSRPRRAASSTSRSRPGRAGTAPTHCAAPAASTMPSPWCAWRARSSRPHSHGTCTSRRPGRSSAGPASTAAMRKGRAPRCAAGWAGSKPHSLTCPTSFATASGTATRSTKHCSRRAHLALGLRATRPCRTAPAGPKPRPVGGNARVTAGRLRWLHEIRADLRVDDHAKDHHVPLLAAARCRGRRRRRDAELRPPLVRELCDRPAGDGRWARSRRASGASC